MTVKNYSEILYNEYTIIVSLYSGSVYENPVEKFKFNPEKAMRLLKEAGYETEIRGILIHNESESP